jgi:hypothetical protein
MSENLPFPEEPRGGADEERDAPLLADVEQRLKRARPRPPKVDVQTIMRLAQTTEEPVGLARRPAGFRQGRSRGWAAVAGAWLCGAIAGAVATFIILGRPVPSEPRSDPVVAEQEPLPKVTEAGRENVSDDDAHDHESDDSQPTRKESWSSEDLQLTLALLDPYASRTAFGEFNRTTLRAGVMRQGRTLSSDGHSVHGGGPSLPGVEDVPYSADRIPQGVMSSAIAEPSISRERLLEELLGASPDSVF